MQVADHNYPLAKFLNSVRARAPAESLLQLSADGPNPWGVRRDESGAAVLSRARSVAGFRAERTSTYPAFERLSPSIAKPSVL